MLENALRRATIGLALLALAIPATAQTSVGSIRVLVADADGGALPGASCEARTTESVVSRSAVAGDNGEVLLPAMDPSSRYVVTCSLDGFSGTRNENVLVTSGQTTTLRVTMQLSQLTEEVTVVAETPLVDTTSAVIGQEITLELAEALPTGRSYQSYLQLVPGVSPDISTTNPAGSGNPAARSGLNYADIGGVVGTSADNFYYIEGINVTDPLTGTFGANLNTEIIQEQKVLTGGIPAEFVGAAGLVSNVITKSGGENFSGSVRYDREDDSLVADNENVQDQVFGRDDMAATIGGPIVRGDKAWFFGSYREINREDTLASIDGDFLRAVEREDQQGFLKLSWAATQNQTVTGTYLSDPTEISGQNDRTILNNRDRAIEQGGDRYLANYTGVFGPTVLSLGVGEHNGEVSTFAAVRDPLNTIVFRGTDGSTLADRQRGGFGQDAISERDTEFMKGDFEWYFGTGPADHTLKFGVDFQDHINLRDTVFTGPQYRGSLGPSLNGISAGELAALAAAGELTTSFFRVTNTSDFNFLVNNTINNSPNRAALYNIFDLNHDGVITQDELGQSMTFGSTAGNPNGAINYDRIIQASSGAQETSSEGLSLYLQDQFRFDNWTFNVGVRAEEWTHFGTFGDEIFTFDWELAPRISAAWDIRGDGKQKLSAFYGRYYDPIRNNLTNFAGTFSGSILEEQVYAGGEWLTYRVRGGVQQLDAAFSPTTKTPYTDEYLVTYQRDLGSNMAFEANVFRRETEDTIEDYDLCLYAGECYPGDPDAPGSLFLGPEYFGYTTIPENINFFIATLAGGGRELNGAELVLRKRLANRWQGIFSYTYSDFEGSTNSDSNADFAGDVLFMDPRAPNMEGTQPGSMDHLVKLQGSYHFDLGLVVGATYRWNSGVYQTRSQLAFARHLPVQGEAFEFGGVTENWVAPGSIGGVEGPSYGVLDVSTSYHRDFGPIGGELFLSVFNILDEQDAVLVQDLASGDGETAFGEDRAWISPRSISLGLRLSFGR